MPVTSKGGNPRRFWDEFKRRRVGRVTLAYLAGSWLLIEVSSQVFPALMLPEWASRLVVIVAIAGLPAVVIVAWIFDLTPQGVVRTPALVTPRPANRQQLAEIVGREKVLSDLADSFESVRSGSGQFLGVAGEAGMGKSTVTNSFFDRLRVDDPTCLVGSGRSSERHGETSAYVPIIEALSGLVHADESGDIARTMAKCAPTWYELVFADHETNDDIQGERAKSQSRMQLELGVMLGQVCSKQPVVICFDDFHWADVSTLDAIVYIADRLDDLALLLIVSYRESELQQVGHPFLQARLSLQSRAAFREIRLEPWDVAQVRELIESEFPDNSFPPELHSRIFDRTRGHPLFVIETIRYLKDSAAVRQQDKNWVLAADIDDVMENLPESVRSVIERNMGRIDEADRRLLSAASIQGQTFDSAVLARVLDTDAADIEERLDKLENVHSLVRIVDEQEMPDGTLSSRYDFDHILYHDYFLSSLKPSRKVAWAKSTAHALSAYYQHHQGDIASELAHLYAAARDYQAAATHYLNAASNSTTVFAYRESAVMARHGLDTISAAPPSPEHDRNELLLQLALGRSLCMTEGYGSHDTMCCFERALELTEEMPDDEQDPNIFWGLWMAYTNTGNRDRSLELSNRLQALAGNASDSILTAAAHLSAGLANEISGHLREASEHYRIIINLGWNSGTQERVSRYVVDPLILARGNQLRLLALMGMADESRDRWDRNLALANDAAVDPRSTAGLLIEGAWFHAFYNRFEETLELTERTIELCTRYDLFMEQQWAAFLHSWANTRLGDVEKGLAGMAAFIGFIDATGALMHAPLYFAVYGETLFSRDRRDDAKTWVKRGLEVIDHTGQGFFASELHRLRGEIAAAEAKPDLALTSLREAHRIARDQGARLLELRAAMSLHRWMNVNDPEDDGLRVLRESVERMHAGFDSYEFRQALDILKETA